MNRSGKLLVLAFVASLLSGSLVHAAYSVYVSNGGGQIYQYDTNGNQSVLATLSDTPQGLVLDPNGNLYVAEYNSNAIVKIAPNGQVSIFATAGLSNPRGLAMDTNGNIYAANFGNDTITEYTRSGQESLFATNEVNQPYGLAMDPNGNLLVANYGYSSITRYSPSGAVSPVINGYEVPHGVFSSPTGIACDSNGVVYASCLGRVLTVESVSMVGFYPDTNWNDPNGLAFDQNGNLYIAQWTGDNILKSTQWGLSTVFASGLSHPAFVTVGIGPSGPAPHAATAMAIETNGFVVGAGITEFGFGYTNTPTVKIIGGGGSGAQAVAVVSNGVVVALNFLDAGHGYTNTPLVIIDPPFIPTPALGIAPMSFLTFSSLTVGGVYQLQQSAVWYWTNLPLSFTSTSDIYTQMVSGIVGTGDYRLALNPVPAQAFATAEVDNGFIIGAIVTAGGSGYITTPAVNIIGDVGSNATAVAVISGGAVTNIVITRAGGGYTNAVAMQIDPPPAAAISPTIQPVMRVDSLNLAPYDNYQIQFEPNITGPWGNWVGGLFSPTDVTNSQFLFITNGSGYFRLQYLNSGP